MTDEKVFLSFGLGKVAEFPSEKVEKSEKDRDLILGSVFSRTQ